MGRGDRRDWADAAVCPGWCRGCGPNDPMHHSDIMSVGREASGWVSLYVIRDRFGRREAMIRLDATRHSGTQSVLLNEEQTGRLLLELARGRVAMRESVPRRNLGRSGG